MSKTEWPLQKSGVMPLERGSSQVTGEGKNLAQTSIPETCDFRVVL